MVKKVANGTLSFKNGLGSIMWEGKRVDFNKEFVIGIIKKANTRRGFYNEKLNEVKRYILKEEYEESKQILKLIANGSDINRNLINTLINWVNYLGMFKHNEIRKQSEVKMP